MSKGIALFFLWLFFVGEWCLEMLVCQIVGWFCRNVRKTFWYISCKRGGCKRQRKKSLRQVIITRIITKLKIGDTAMMYRNSWIPEVFNGLFNDGYNMPKANTTAPAINVKESQTQYTVEVAAPGMRKEDFEVNLNENGDLHIKMENKRQDNPEEHVYLRREFSYAKFEQTLILPDDVDKEKITASVADGVLTIGLPKMTQEEQKVARQITVG